MFQVRVNLFISMLFVNFGVITQTNKEKYVNADILAIEPQYEIPIDFERPSTAFQCLWMYLNTFFTSKIS